MAETVTNRRPLRAVGARTSARDGADRTIVQDCPRSRNAPGSPRRRYEFATTFYPLWLGMASPAQARRVLASLEAPGGLLTSTTVSGSSEAERS